MADGRIRRRGKRGEPGVSPGELDILRDWVLIEADFQREYRLELAKELPQMSWRRFQALLSGLGPDSAFVTHYQAKHMKHGRSDDGDIITDPVKAEQAVKKVWG